jgi:hypothetical protein
VQSGQRGKRVRNLCRRCRFESQASLTAFYKAPVLFDFPRATPFVLNGGL